jgi:peptidoglycan L-alanyl-D-glutamate endopeptidase CwlK
MDRVTLQRIQLLHPKVRGEVEHIYKSQIVPALSGRAICRFAYTLRTFEEQNELFAIGRTKLFDNKGKRLGVVTNATSGQSIHNYGLALDIVLLEDTDKNGSFETAKFNIVMDYDGDKKADWMEVVDIFKKNGWEWGGDWRRFPDAPHFEKNFGYTWRQLKKLYDKNKFIPGTKYIQI